jgi:dihydroneopterin aldolase
MADAAALKIFVRGLHVDAEIGVYPHEKGRTQPLTIDIELILEPRDIRSIRDTVNYETLAANARALATGGHVDLVETFAEDLARACLADPHTLSARVRIEKPLALEGAEAAGVEVLLKR